MGRCGATAVEDGLSYMKSHEWARLDGDTITVGISDFAQVRRQPLTRFTTYCPPPHVVLPTRAGNAIPAFPAR